MTNKEIAKSWYSAIDKKDFQAVNKLMHAHHQFSNPMSPSPIGKEEHLGMMKMMTDAFSGAHHIELILEDGNHIVVRGKWSGKHTGEFNGVGATNNPVTFSFIDIFDITDGKVRKEALEFNPMSIMTQIEPEHAS